MVSNGRLCVFRCTRSTPSPTGRLPAIPRPCVRLTAGCPRNHAGNRGGEQPVRDRVLRSGRRWLPVALVHPERRGRSLRPRHPGFGVRCLPASGAQPRHVISDREIRAADGRRDGDQLVLDFPAMPPLPCAHRKRSPRRSASHRRHCWRRAIISRSSSGPRRSPALAPDFAAVAALDRFAVIATAPGIDRVDFVSRFFAPAHGVPEIRDRLGTLHPDPVLGGAARQIAARSAAAFAAWRSPVLRPERRQGHDRRSRRALSRRHDHDLTAATIHAHRGQSPKD